MTTYSDSNFNSSHYDSARPSYPDSFYETLISYHDKGSDHKRKLAVDLGCGSGFATFKLASYFDTVWGTDPSKTMIDLCKKDSRYKPEDNKIKFTVAYAEELPQEIEANSVDLVSAAESFHWVDHERAFIEAHRVLKTGGTLAYWFYNDPIFVGHPRANELYQQFTYGNSIKQNKGTSYQEFMGPYWQQPGRNLLRNLLRDVNVPCDLFADITRVEYHPETENRRGSSSLYISRKTSLQGILEYVKSWSAYHSWIKENREHGDVAEAFVEALRKELGWDESTEIEVVWDTVYTISRKI